MRSKLATIVNLVENDEKLKPLTNRRPIASLPFACRYRLIDFPFSSLYNAQAISAAVFISGSGHSLYDHIRAGSTWGLDSLAGGGVFTHSQVKLKSEVTGSEAQDPFYYEDHYNYVVRSKSEYVVLIGSSMLANVDLSNVLNYHEEKNSDLTVVYKNVARDTLREDSTYSKYTLDDENESIVTESTPLSEVPTDSTKTAVGMDMLIVSKKRFLDYLQVARERNLYVNVENLIQFAFEAEDSVYGYEYTGYLKAIEDIKSYFEANMDMLNQDNFNSLFYRANPVLTKPKNSAPSYYGKEAYTHNSQFANDCKVYGSVENSLVFRKVTIEKNAKVNNSIVMQDCIIEEGAELNYVILDKHVYVKKGAKLEGTPEEPIVIGKNEVITSEGELVEG